MDIPLKSRPKVSTVKLHEEGTFYQNQQAPRPDDSSDTLNVSRNQADASKGAHKPNYKLVRTFSESEANNFDNETGHRIYEDGKIRPKMSRSNTRQMGDSSPSRLHLRSHNEFVDDPNAEYTAGLEDEYIPGLNFADMVAQWTKSSSSENLPFDGGRVSGVTSASNTPLSRNQSYLDLNELHAQVAPKPINRRNQENKMSFTKLQEAMKMRTPSSNSMHDPLSVSSSRDPLTHQSKKQKSARADAPGDINYELIIESLPTNFNELPYSQRKKIVKSFSDSIDYSQFSLFAKDYLTKFADGRTSRSGSTSGSLRLSRRNSTVAGRLLALSSSSDLKKLNEPKNKVNVDEKGAQVMEYEMGKIIGYGAWGTIRECTDDKGNVRAVKIVKSCRDRDSSPSQSRSRSPSRIANNAQVLEFFKKEIIIWEQLHHPNILPLIKYLETETAIFCITDKIPGGTLFDLVLQWGNFDSGISNNVDPVTFLFEQQRRRLAQCAGFILQISEGLHYMHYEKGIVHGDLKLENVLVDDHDASAIKMILCDFGMSRVYTTRSNRTLLDGADNSPTIRSRSSFTRTRKPFHGGHTKNTSHLFTDDSKIGLSNLFKSHGPSMQSVSLTPTDSLSLADTHELTGKLVHVETPDSGLPHSHIGSLPYASPELLSPSPPPLGPSADIWALGVLTYTMVVGRLPFQHAYEPRLRAIITAGQFNKDDLKLACLVLWNYGKIADGSGEEVMSGLSFAGAGRAASLRNLQQQFNQHNAKEYQFLYELVLGCLELDITKRWDLEMVRLALQLHTSDHV